MNGSFRTYYAIPRRWIWNPAVLQNDWYGDYSVSFLNMAFCHQLHIFWCVEVFWSPWTSGRIEKNIIVDWKCEVISNREGFGLASFWMNLRTTTVVPQGKLILWTVGVSFQLSFLELFLLRPFSFVLGECCGCSTGCNLVFLDTIWHYLRFDNVRHLVPTPVLHIVTFGGWWARHAWMSFYYNREETHSFNEKAVTRLCIRLHICFSHEVITFQCEVH